MDLRQLKAFVNIVEFGSVTRAAEFLNIAQPALGQQIRKLEEELEVQLLIRHSRGVEPTPAGLAFLDHARDILARAVAAKTAMLEFSDKARGRVLIGLTPSINFMIAPPLIRSCARELPDVALSIEEQLSGVLLEWTAEERLAMCLANRATDHPGLVYEPLFRESLYLVCREGQFPAAQTTLSLRELVRVPLIMPSLPHALRRLVEDYAAKAGLSLTISFEMQSVSVVRELVADGVGATILPYGGARRSVAGGGLVALKIVDPVLTREVYLCYPSRRAPSTAEQRVRELVKAVVRETLPSTRESWAPLAAS